MKIQIYKMELINNPKIEEGKIKEINKDSVIKVQKYKMKLINKWKIESLETLETYINIYLLYQLSIINHLWHKNSFSLIINKNNNKLTYNMLSKYDL